MRNAYFNISVIFIMVFFDLLSFDLLSPDFFKSFQLTCIMTPLKRNLYLFFTVESFVLRKQGNGLLIGKERSLEKAAVEFSRTHTAVALFTGYEKLTDSWYFCKPGKVEEDEKAKKHVGSGSRFGVDGKLHASGGDHQYPARREQCSDERFGVIQFGFVRDGQPGSSI